MNASQLEAIVDASNQPKRLVDNWLQASDAIDCDDLVALVDALDCLKKDAQHKLSLRKATRAGITPYRRSVGTSGANQGLRRSSRRIASAAQLASSASLFVDEHDAESESGDGDHETLPAILDKASSCGHTMAMTSSSEVPIENVHEIEVVRRRLAAEQESPSYMVYETIPADNEQENCRGIQPARVFSQASNTLSHQSTCANTQSGVDTPHQAAEDSRYSGLQSLAESLHHAPFNQLCSPVAPTYPTEVDNSDEEEMVMHDAPTPRFFDEAFEDLYGSPVQHGLQKEVEEAMTDCDKQHPTDQNHTQNFGDDPMFQSYLDLACRSSFRLPHEPVEDTDVVEVRELLSPLVEGKPLTPRLLHGLIYSLVPGPLRILEVDSGASGGEPSLDESLVENFAVILCQSEGALPQLLLGAAKRKTLFTVGSFAVDLPFLDTLCPMLPEWKRECINV